MCDVERKILKLIYEMCGEYVALNWYSKEGETAARQIKEKFRDDKFNLFARWVVWGVKKKKTYDL